MTLICLLTCPSQEENGLLFYLTGKKVSLWKCSYSMQLLSQLKIVSRYVIIYFVLFCLVTFEKLRIQCLLLVCGNKLCVCIVCARLCVCACSAHLVLATRVVRWTSFGKVLLVAYFIIEFLNINFIIFI